MDSFTGASGAMPPTMLDGSARSEGLPGPGSRRLLAGSSHRRGGGMVAKSGKLVGDYGQGLASASVGAGADGLLQRKDSAAELARAAHAGVEAQAARQGSAAGGILSLAAGGLRTDGADGAFAAVGQSRQMGQHLSAGMRCSVPA